MIYRKIRELVQPEIPKSAKCHSNSMFGHKSAFLRVQTGLRLVEALSEKNTLRIKMSNFCSNADL